MALLLNIDCATNNASVSISNNEVVIAAEESTEQKEHASFIQPAIKSLLQKTGISLIELEAVAVTEGPGSYTGLRVGMASAKGICYALNKPLITINTLEVMAHAAITKFQFELDNNSNILFCPMIDARRMEVFTAMYNYKLEKIIEPYAIEIIPSTFDMFSKYNLIYCFGSGNAKCKDVVKNSNVMFEDITHGASDIAVLSNKAFMHKTFANLAYAEPFYLKEFYSNNKV